MRIWLVPALAAVMVISAVVASTSRPLALAPALALAPPAAHFALPPPPATVPVCDAYLAHLAQYAACERIPSDARAAIRSAIDQMRPTLRDASPAVHDTLVDACSQGDAALAQALPAMGC